MSCTSLGLAVTYTPTLVELTAALLGDGDLDGDVDFVDFVNLSNNFGGSGTWVDGDYNGSGIIDFPDFVGLSNNFGASAAIVASATIAAVPEPGTLALLLFGCLASLCRVRVS